jgi:alpha-glucosidase
MLLGMGLSGVPFVGSDVGGYSGRASPELYARWMELGALSPFFRAHVTQGVPGQEPWMFGQEVEDISRDRIRARYAFLPYLQALFEEHRTTGLPLLRALALERFRERALRRVDDQAMLGPFLLVAPITREGASSRAVILPEGRWVDLESGALYDGPATVELGGTLAAIPVLARAGTILPRWSDPGQNARADHGTLTFDLVPSLDESSLTLHDDADDSVSTGALQRVSLVGDARGARFWMEPRRGHPLPGPRPIVLRVVRVDRPVTRVLLGSELGAYASREDFDRADLGFGWFHDTNERALYVRFVSDGSRDVVVQMEYDPTITELRPPVDVGIEVEVPAGTPTTTPIHVTSEAVGWAQIPLAWTGPTTARGTLTVPRGAWFFYKFTRGSFDTVEKWPGCAEATNRYRYGQARTRRDTVYGWRDWCP